MPEHLSHVPLARRDSSPQAEVVVVGAGPIGLTVACLLADLGVSVRVLEAAATAADEPRAISIVDESLRTLQALDLVDEVAADLVWNTGSSYLGAKGQPLVVVEPAVATFGYPQKSFFDQPGLQRALLRGAEVRPNVTIEYGCAVSSVSDHGDHVEIRAQREGRDLTVRAAYVVGCDGGRSVVRTSSGIAMSGSSQQEPWIVLDLDHDSHDERRATFHCDPRRPAVIVPGTQGRCRYEFMLLPGETAEQVLVHEFVSDLVTPYRGPLDPLHVRRKTVYVSHQLVAERWRQGRVMLAGDAAHLMPPFAGQGLNTGMRDARNLAWKLAAVVRGEATERLLDTYDTERRPHAVQMVQLSHRMGRLIMTTDRRRAWLRDTAFRLAGVAPSIKQYFGAMKFVKRPKITEGCVVSLAPDQAIVGSSLPQPVVIDARGRRSMLDDRLGPGWALVAVGPHEESAFEGVMASLGHLQPTCLQVLARDKVARLEHQYCDTEGFVPIPGEPRYLLVRPDRIVAADFTAAEAAVVARSLAPLLSSALTSPNAKAF